MTEDTRPQLGAASEPPRALPPGPSSAAAPSRALPAAPSPEAADAPPRSDEPSEAPPGGSSTVPPASTLPPFPHAHPPGLAPDPRSTLRPIVTLAGDKFAWANGARAMFAVGIPFAFVTAVGGVANGASAAVGGYAVLYATRDPYARRARVLAAVGLGLAVAYALGALVAGHAWPGVCTLTVVAAAATFLCSALRVGRPGGYMFTLVCAMGTFLPPDPAGIPADVGLLLLGTASAWLVSMSGWLVRPHHPEHVAIADAFRAVAGFLDAIGGEQLDAQRHKASGALYDAWVALIGADSKHADRSGEVRRLQVLVRRVFDIFHAGEVLAEERSRPLPPQIGDLVRGLADAVGQPERTPELPAFLDDAETDGQRELRASLRKAANASAQCAIPGASPLQGERPRALELVRAAAGPASLIVPVSVRTGLAVGAATAVAALLPIVHPSWVAIGAAAALQGGNAVLDLEKALQRAIGTFLGVAIVVLFLHDLSPGPWAIVALVSLLYGAAQTVMRRNLVVGVACITPVPLLLVGAGLHGSHVGDLAPTRLLDMLLGLGVGLFTSFVLWRRASTGRLPAALGRAIRAEALLLKAAVTGNAEENAKWLRLRTAVRRELVDAWNAYESALGELAGRRASAERAWPVLIVVQRLGFRLMTAPLKPSVPAEEALPGDDAAALDRYLQELASAAEERRAPVPPELPELWGHPVLRQHLKRLARALTEAAQPPAPGFASHFLAGLSEPPRRVREAEMPSTGQLR